MVAWSGGAAARSTSVASLPAGCEDEEGFRRLVRVVDALPAIRRSGFESKGSVGV